MLFFLLFGRGRVVFFAVWAGAWAPPKQQKKKPQPKQPKKHTHTHTHPSLPSVFVFLLFGCSVWAGGVFCFLLFGRRSCSFFAVWAGGVFFVLLFGRGSCSFFCCLGGGRVFFCCLGGRREVTLTGLPGWSLKDPGTKKTKQQKK